MIDWDSIDTVLLDMDAAMTGLRVSRSGWYGREPLDAPSSYALSVAQVEKFMVPVGGR